MLYVNDEPEGTFLYTGTINLCCKAVTHATFSLNIWCESQGSWWIERYTNSKQILADFERSETEGCGCVLVGWGSRRDHEEGGGAGPLNLAQKISWAGRCELDCESWTSFASGCSSTAVQRTLSLWLCQHGAVETGIAQCTSRCGNGEGIPP